MTRDYFYAWTKISTVLFIFSFFILFVLYLNRIGKTSLASFLLCYFFMSGACLVVYVSDLGVKDSVMLLLPCTIGIAGLLLTKKQFFAFSVISLVNIIFLTFLDSAGYIGTHVYVKVSMWDALDYTLMVGVTAIVTSVLSGELRKSLKQEHESQRLLRAIWEKSADGMRLTNSNGIIIMVNEAFCEMVGKTREEFEGKSLSVMFKPEGRTKVEENYKIRFLQRSIPTHVDAPVTLWNGTTVSMEITNSFIESDKHQPLLLSIFRNVTERKRLEQQLIQSQKLEGIGTLAGGIAHEFNNLLAMVMGSAELLLMQTEEQPQLQKYIRRIIETTERGSSISRQLLIFSRPAMKELKTVSLSQVIIGMSEMLTHFLPKSITIKTELPAAEGTIKGDAGQIHQALLNLALNAGEAMPKGGTIVIREYVPDASELKAKFNDEIISPCICISIADTGTGMNPDIVAQMFNPFFTTKERGKGTGLGLAIVHGIVNNHGGRIEVQSTPGVGTTFTLGFPSHVR